MSILWKNKKLWVKVPNSKGEEEYFFSLKGLTSEEKVVFEEQMTECQVKGSTEKAAFSKGGIEKGDLVFKVLQKEAKNLDGIYDPQYSELCSLIKSRWAWDKIFMVLGREVCEGYRINISLAKEFEIERAKQILSDENIIFEDKKATSTSDRVKPGDRTLRVIQPMSITYLRQFWRKNAKPVRFASVERK